MKTDRDRLEDDDEEEGGARSNLNAANFAGLTIRVRPERRQFFTLFSTASRPWSNTVVTTVFR